MEKRNINFILRQEFDLKNICKNEGVCKICKGKFCCQRAACAWSPDDFYVTRNFFKFTDEEQIRYLKSFIKRGYTSIEYWSFYNDSEKLVFLKELAPKEEVLNDHGGFYLRAREKDAEVVDILHFINEDEKPCILWSEEEGCKLSYSKRPKGGRMLIPDSIDNECISIYKEEQAAIDWYPFQEVLYQLYCYFKHNRY